MHNNSVPVTVTVHQASCPAHHAEQWRFISKCLFTFLNGNYASSVTFPLFCQPSSHSCAFVFNKAIEKSVRGAVDYHIHGMICVFVLSYHKHYVEGRGQGKISCI